MHFTRFAGLTELDPGDPITIDGASFTQDNPTRTDLFLRIGAVTHKHDAHPQIPNPTLAPSGSVSATGGFIPADTSLYVGYTLVDSYGGETLMGPVLVLTTSPAANAPSAAINAVFDSAGGSLPTGQYSYALTMNDAAGNESLLGPAVFVTRSPGFPSGQVDLSALAQEVGNGVYVSYNLWRAQDGGDFQVIATSQTSGTFTDTGLICTDAARTPPVDNSQILSNNTATITIPTAIQDPSIAQSSFLNFYLSFDGSFPNPCFYMQAPVASAGHAFTVTSPATTEGQPPAVSLASQGANQIDPDTDMLDFPWKRPVSTFGALPASGNDVGDMREALDTLTIYSWDGSGWEAVSGGGGGATRFLASAQDGTSAVISGLLGFDAVGGSATVQDLGGGSAIVKLAFGTATGGTGPAGPTGPTGPQGPAGAGAAGMVGIAVASGHGSTVLVPETYVEVLGSGGIGAAVQNLGGGSARILIGASGFGGVAGPQGPAGPTGPTGPQGPAGGGGGGGSIAIGGSGGVGQLNPTSDIEFAGSGGVGVAVQSLGGGSARVLIGAQTRGPRLIDLCAVPYSCVAGTDVTTALQTAINDINTAGLDTILFFSKPGVYNVNGSQVTGTANGYSYSGQVLFPARAPSSGTISIRILGTAPSSEPIWGAGEPASTYGAVLLSNAASGAIFDAIPSFTSGGTPFTAINVSFEHIVIRAPANTPCTAVNGQAFRGLSFYGQNKVDVNQAVALTWAAPTGSGVGIVFPGPSNSATCVIDGMTRVSGYPTGVKHCEHLLANGLHINQCNTGLEVYGGSGLHPSRYGLVSVEECQTVLYANPSGGGGRVEGSLAVETGGASSFPFTSMYTDTGNLIYGELRISMSTGGNTVGWPKDQGSNNLNWRGFDQGGGRSWQEAWPYDNFARYAYPQTNMGVSDWTLSPWLVQAGSFNIAAAGSLKSTQSAATSLAFMQYAPGKSGPSRIVRMVVTTPGGAYNPGLVLSATLAQTAWLFVGLFDSGANEGQVNIQRFNGGAYTTLASASGQVARSTQYTIDVVIVNTPGVYTINVYKLAGIGSAYQSGTNILSYTLNSTDISDIADTASRIFTQDGVRFKNDTSSVISQVRVLPY